MEQKFDYEKKNWGTGGVDLNPKFLGATRLKYALKDLKSINEGKVLELGCGGGNFARAIKKYRPEFDVIGCDLSAQSIAIAIKKKRKVKYQQADLYHLPFKDHSFQALVSFDVWEHLDCPDEALGEAFRVLKKGGTFHFYVPLEGSTYHIFRILPKKIFEFKQSYTGHVQAYSKAILLELLSDAGFEVKKIHYSSYYLYQLVDAMYFTLLRLRGRNAAVSVEGYLEFASGSLFDRILSVSKFLFSWASYLENEIFSIFPGGGIHITAIKK